MSQRLQLVGLALRRIGTVTGRGRVQELASLLRSEKKRNRSLNPVFFLCFWFGRGFGGGLELGRFFVAGSHRLFF